MSEKEKKRVIRNIMSFFPIFQKEILDVFHDDNKDLSPLSFKALCEIYFSQNISPSVLTKRLGITVPNTSRLLLRLSDSGYIVKVKDEEDKRITRINLAPKGIEIVEKSRKSVDDLMLKKLDILELDELITLSNSFLTITKLFKKMN